MASYSSIWTAPSLTQYRPVLLALTALAAGCTIYYLHEQTQSPSTVPETSLQRSNARRRRRSPPRRPNTDLSDIGLRRYGPPGLTERSRYVPDVPWGTVPVSLDFLTDAAIAHETFGHHLFNLSGGDPPTFVTSIRRQMPLEEHIRTVVSNSEEVSTIRREIESAFLNFYFWKHIPPSTITDEQRSLIVSHLMENGGFSADMINATLNAHQAGTLTQSIDSAERLFDNRLRAHPDNSIWPLHETLRGYSASTMQAAEGEETVIDVVSEHSWREEIGTGDGEEAAKEGQNLGNLLWRIAEEQARKESYVHRGVTCNSCNAMPIKGIRYHCSNCLNFDLCEQCEALQTHKNTHIFYKVRIPAPFLATSRAPQPEWYPARPTTETYSLPKEIMEKLKRETEYQAVEIEALWEQFKCLASTEWDEDPCKYNMALDRQTFDKCLVPRTSTRIPPPNLIYDRLFSFYDMNDDGLIGFREFINARAVLSKKNPDERWKRVFKGFDIDNDGLVGRRDFLRMFNAYYLITKELTLDIVNEMEDDLSDDNARDIVTGSQPISSAFSGTIPPGERLRTNEGKRRDEHGDFQICDDIGGAVDNRDHEIADPDDIIADSAEAARFGYVQPRDSIGPWIEESIINGEWPPAAIGRADVQKAVPHLTELNEITNLEDQNAVRRAAHGRIARDHQERQFVRRIALRNRKQRHSFYFDEMDPAKEENRSGSENESTANFLSQNDRSRKDDLTRILGSTKAGEFRMRLLESIKAMEWPLDSPENLMNDVFEMIYNGWGGRDIAEDLSGYGSRQHDAKEFIATFDSLVILIGDAIKSSNIQESTDEQRKFVPSSWSRRSRSSSKVRFRDDVGTDDEHDSRSRATSISSRSIPVNERWGGFIPEPENDVGQEVLYQVTQEALNELLDPIFRLREDLALAAFRTMRERLKHQAAIVAAVQDLTSIKGHLYNYQRRWRRHQQKLPSGYLGPEELGETFGADRLLMSFKLSGKGDYRFAERCARCKTPGAESWITRGFYCAGCCIFHAQVSAGTATDPENPLIKCPNCDTWRLTSGHCCRSCGGVKEIYEENEKLRKMLLRTKVDSVQEVVQGKGELKPTTNRGTKRSRHGEAVENLDNSVRVFDEANPPALEENIARKPLEDLPAESGYAAASPTVTSRTLPPPPGLTLPQPRPYNAHDFSLILQSLQSNGTSESEASESTSHLFSLPTTQSQSPSTRSKEPPESPAPDPTLPQNRPDSVSTPSAMSTEDDSTSIAPSTSSPELIPKTSMNDAQSGTQTSTDSDATIDDVAAAAVDEAGVDLSTLAYYAALGILEEEDSERGGAGRLNFSEWQEVMKGEKGASLGFLASWLEVASF